MKVVLLQDVKNLGRKNEVVNVNDGYYKNFLAKQKLAVVYTPAAAKHLQQDLKTLDKQHQAKLDEAQALADKIGKVSLEFALANNAGKAFGSISQKQIIAGLESKGIKITKYMFNPDFEPLKIGKFEITLNIWESINAN